MKLRHKAELKALMAQAAKGIGAKKKQKEDAAEMEKQQAEQMKELERKEKEEKESEENGGEAAAAPAEAAPTADDAASASAASSSSATASSAAASKQPSRAQQKKARAAEKEKARSSELKEMTKDMVDARGNEDKAIRERMEKEQASRPSTGKLRVREMVSDGHCLYRAVADQVHRHHLQRDLALNDNVHPFMAMRQLAADYISQHRSEFEPFMLVEDADGKALELTEETWRAYLKDLVDEELAVWGGHQEAVALSKALKRCIVIWSADGRMEVGEEFQATPTTASPPPPAAAAAAADPAASSPSSPAPDQLPIQISFHQHYYGLGAHYNSVVTDEEADDQEAFEKGEQ